MRLRCHRLALLEALKLALGAAEAKAHARPVLGMVLLETGAGTGGEGVRLTATDLEVGVRLPVPGAEVVTPGTALLCRQVFEELKESSEPACELSMNPGGEMVRVVCGERAVFDNPTADPEGFPRPEFARPDGAPSMRGESLLWLLARTSFAAATEGGRYATAGVLLDIDPETGACIAVGTDGKRLSVARSDGPVDSPEAKASASPVLPTKAVDALTKLLASCNESDRCSVVLSANNGCFSCADWALTTRLLEGRYPDYKGVLLAANKDGRPPVRMDTQALAQAVRQAELAADEATPWVTFAFGPGRLVLTASGATSGSGRVEAVCDGDRSASVRLDPKYVLSFLKAAGAEQQVEIYPNGGGEPVLFRAGGRHDYVVMPLT